MFQKFDEAGNPSQGPERLAALRQAMARAGLDGFIVPRADAFQGEYVAPCDARLAWLTGFTGSAGFCIALRDEAGIFVDGRYRVQVRAQVDEAAFSPVEWPEVQPWEWVKPRLGRGARLGFDPWLHTIAEIGRYRDGLAGSGIELTGCDNLVDRIWADRPGPPMGRVIDYPVELAGESSHDKRKRLAQRLREAGQRAAVITLPDSICWLLNLRGADIERNPVVQAFAVLHDDARVTLFSEPGKFSGIDLPAGVKLERFDAFQRALAALAGPVRLEHESASQKVADILAAAGTTVLPGRDPCSLPKARKNAVEIAGMRKAHLRDGAAMATFLCWLDDAMRRPGLSEIEIVEKLEECRRATGVLRDISFDTICGSGPNGALPHYRVSERSNRTLRPGDLIVIDSGGQYLDGTTDITRTVAMGPAGQDERLAFTRVLQGMIAISRVRWPRGRTGRDLDPLARYPLWAAGQDFDHGTGHGVGAYLCVHEGPQRISRLSEIALEPGMILSNEPGYYREGAFGIRTENLVVVREAPPLAGADARDMLGFETLTFVPIDTGLIVAEALAPAERDWLNAYHAEVRRKIGPHLEGETARWLKKATAPI